MILKFNLEGNCSNTITSKRIPEPSFWHHEDCTYYADYIRNSQSFDCVYCFILTRSLVRRDRIIDHELLTWARHHLLPVKGHDIARQQLLCSAFVKLVLLINAVRSKVKITDDERKIKLANPGHRVEINLYCRGFGCYNKITYLWVNESIINSTYHTQSSTVIIIIGGHVKIAG